MAVGVEEVEMEGLGGGAGWVEGGVAAPGDEGAGPVVMVDVAEDRLGGDSILIDWQYLIMHAIWSSGLASFDRVVSLLAEL